MNNQSLTRSGAWLGLVGCVALTTVGQAAFTYSSGDLLLAFRNSSPNDMVVNLGPVTQFQTAGQSFNISQYSPSWLTGASPSSGMGGLNSLSVSLSAELNSDKFGLPTSTLWLSRGSLLDAWTPASEDAQGVSAAKVRGIGVGGVANYAGAVLKTDTAVLSGDSLNNSATKNLGSSGNLGGTWEGSIEVKTSATFGDNPANTVSLKLYELVPGSVDPRELGTFTLNGQGQMNYQAVAAVPEPTTWALLGLGGAALLALRRNRRDA